jgi:hypothetical protein
MLLIGSLRPPAISSLAPLTFPLPSFRFAESHAPFLAIRNKVAIFPHFPQDTIPGNLFAKALQ